MKTVKTILLAAALLHLGGSVAMADACLDRFVEILTDRSDKGPVKAHVIQENAGAPAMENYHYSTSRDHWMTETIKPAGMAWSLGYKNVLYTSTDKGKTWQRVRTLEDEQSTLKALRENARTARNAVCGKEDLDGVSHDTVEGDYTYRQNLKIEYHNKYWIDPETGFIRKSVYTFTAKNFKGRVVQLMEKAPGLSLPVPE